MVRRDKKRRQRFLDLETKRLAVKILQRSGPRMQAEVTSVKVAANTSANTLANTSADTLGVVSIGSSLSTRHGTRTLHAGLRGCEFSRDSSLTRVRNRCVLGGRGGGVLSDFRLSRIYFRELALLGKLPGVKKASW